MICKCLQYVHSQTEREKIEITTGSFPKPTQPICTRLLETT